jgi:hypothetical protein
MAGPLKEENDETFIGISMISWEIQSLPLYRGVHLK